MQELQQRVLLHQFNGLGQASIETNMMTREKLLHHSEFDLSLAFITGADSSHQKNLKAEEKQAEEMTLKTEQLEGRCLYSKSSS